MICVVCQDVCSSVLTVGLKHAEDLGASDGADLGDTGGVTQDHADLHKTKNKTMGTNCETLLCTHKFDKSEKQNENA